MNSCLFDTHADTAYEMYKRKLGLYNGELHISLDYTKKIKKYCQCMALWSDKVLSDNDAYMRFFDMYRYLCTELEKTDEAVLCRTYREIEDAHSRGKAAFVLTVEDARLLSGELSRLDKLYEYGVRMLTFQWEGETCTGGGFDTDLPLTEFGKATAHRCAELGIIPDISHSCERTAYGILEIMSEYNKPAIATHSNSYSVCPHRRNLTDKLFLSLMETGGIAGISLAVQHLCTDAHASSQDVLSHIEHYSEIGGIYHICLGCDFDGIATTPTDIKDIRYIDCIAEALLSHNYKEAEVEGIFFRNAQRFLAQNM